jgi:hypothetical protein
MTLAQLSGRTSLRDVVSNLSAQAAKLYSLDASTIDLCLSVFPWAQFRTTKGAGTLHVGLDHEGMLPTFLTIIDGKTHDITAAGALRLAKGSIVVMDRGYNDYAWHNKMIFIGFFHAATQECPLPCHRTPKRPEIEGPDQ